MAWPLPRTGCNPEVPGIRFVSRRRCREVTSVERFRAMATCICSQPQTGSETRYCIYDRRE